MADDARETPLASTEEARKLVEEGAQLVDVRSQHEWDAGHIPGAHHIQLNNLTERAGEIDKDRQVVVYCRGGNRSEMAAEALRNSGFDAHSIDGGLVAWDEAGLPLEPEGAAVAPAQNLPPR